MINSSKVKVETDLVVSWETQANICFVFFFLFYSFSIQLQSFLQISVFQIRVDECPGSECAGASGCTNVLNVRDTPTVVDCGTMSLVSVTVESTAVCSCPGREQSHQPCNTYPRNPCFNGGMCVDTQHGYRWVENEHPKWTDPKQSLWGRLY